MAAIRAGLSVDAAARSRSIYTSLSVLSLSCSSLFLISLLQNDFIAGIASGPNTPKLAAKVRGLKLKITALRISGTAEADSLQDQDPQLRGFGRLRQVLKHAPKI